jgi:hypothetical protein
MGLFVVAGCGVGSKKVAGSATTVAASTTAAATSTTSADTSADTSSDTADTTDTSADTSTDTSTDTGSQTVGQTWPKVAQDAFVRSCSASAAADVCKCALRALEPVLSFNDLESIGSGASNVSKFQAQIRKATLECVADPHSH